VTGWRRSPISAGRPDPNQQIAAQDMNSWERITPGATATHAAGYAIYRSTVRPPKIVQSRGGRLVFHALGRDAEIYLDGKRMQNAEIVTLAPGSETRTLSILCAGPGGLTAPVEILAD
jgi:beta-galactosidase